MPFPHKPLILFSGPYWVLLNGEAAEQNRFDLSEEHAFERANGRHWNELRRVPAMRMYFNYMNTRAARYRNFRVYSPK